MAHLLIVESWLEGHGRVLPRLLESMGHTWTFVTRRPEHYVVNGVAHPIMAEAVGVETVETNSAPELSTHVTGLMATIEVDGIFTVCDYYIPHVQRLCAAVGLPSAYGPAAATTRDKATTRALLDLAGLPNPGYVHTAEVGMAVEFARSAGFPVVCKPADLASSALVRRVDDEGELRDAFAEVTGMRQNFRGQPRPATVLVEEWLDGPEFSVEAVTTAGRTEVLGITDKTLAGAPYFIEVGHQFPADLAPDEEDQLSGFVRRCLAAVGFTHGVSHTEVKLTTRGPRLVEINPRPGGNHIVDLVRLVSGVDLLRLQVASCLGESYEPGQPAAVSAASAMLIPDRAGRIGAWTGLEGVRARPEVHELETFVDVPTTVEVPTDNACYLGVLITTDGVGRRAGQTARELAASVRPVYVDEPVGTLR
jgi:biotin carboxylase